MYRTILLSFLALSVIANVAKGQQTIFNVPSQEVLAPGAIYAEVDAPIRLDDPMYVAATPRVVFGLGLNLEAGLNLPGYINEGDKLWTAMLTAKHDQTLDTSLQFTVAEGAHVHIPLTSGRSIGLFGYASAGIKPASLLRVSGGIYGATKPVTGTTDVIGALGAIEIKILSWLTLAVDGFSGENALGYITPGLVISLSNWSLYPAYQISNTSRTGDSYLFEVGYSF